MVELGAIYSLGSVCLAVCLSVCLPVRIFLNCMRLHTGLVSFGHSAKVAKS